MMKEMEIIDRLISNIHSGKYQANEKLPSENQLADEFNVPRMTVRKVFERLQEMGYIYALQGKGSFVKERGIQIPLHLSGDESFSKKMAKLGFDLQTKNIICEPIEYTPDIYSALGAEQKDTVVKIGRLRIVDEIPIALHISYVAEKVFPSIRNDAGTIESMFDYYQSKGYTKFRSQVSTLKSCFLQNFFGRRCNVQV